MSAFMLEDKTFCVLARFFGDLRFEREAPLMYLKAPFGFTESMSEADAHGLEREIACDLRAMNEAALRARYGEASEMLPGGVLDCTGVPYGQATNWQTLKSLDCLLYQCSEGDVLEWDLFKKLDRFRDHLSRVMVTGTPEYEAANWA